jgi:sporulation protein YlmC with PRC-barrel domain
MRASDLLGKDVVGHDGRSVGRVSEIHLVREGPPLGEFGPSYTVDALRVSKHRTRNLFGYERRDARGPVAVRWFFRALHRGDRFVPWDEVVAVTSDAIRL